MQNLTQYRKERGYSQGQFAKIVSTDQSIISRIERGDITPSLRLAVEIERATGGQIPASIWVQTVSPSAAPSSEDAQPEVVLPSNKRLDGSDEFQGAAE